MASRRLNFLLLFVLGFSFNILADSNPMDIWLRTGPISGTYHGSDVTNGKFTSDVNLEAELWLYRSPQTAWIIHTTLANESDLGRTRYLAAGVGQRYFLFTDGFMTDQQTAAGLVQIHPRWSTYVGWDLNLGEFLIYSVGNQLASYATTLDASGCVGVRYMISPRLSVDALGGYSYGASVASSTSVSMTMMRLMVGFGLSF
jgi:hypothetical protein